MKKLRNTILYVVFQFSLSVSPSKETGDSTTASPSESTISTTTTTRTTTTATAPSTTARAARNCEAPGTVCLVGGDPGTSEYIGNVMVGGSPVCDDDWDIADAYVVCRELGYQKAKQAFRESRFGNVSSDFVMDNVKCIGVESRLQDCEHSTQEDCDVSEGAGVECETQIISQSDCYEYDISYTFGESIDQDNKVETPEDCQKYCQELDTCLHFTYYPSQKRCYRKIGNSKTFKDGAISGPRNCSALTVSVAQKDSSCFSFGVGYSYGDYLDYFTEIDYQACQGRCQNHNGCSYFSYYLSNNECYMKTSDGNKRNNPDVVSGPAHCTGEESTTESNPCITPGKMCLVGGGGNHEGNVVIGGKPVCDDNWDMNDGRVVCRELGFHEVERITKESQFGKVSVNFIMDNVECIGTEERLFNCTYNSDDDCGATEGAGVVCDKRSLEEIAAEKGIMQHCFDDGVSYNFGDYLDFEVASNAMSCQKHCMAHPDCSHFSFYQDSRKCYRKTGNTKRSTEGAISGPRNCSDLSYIPQSTLSPVLKDCNSPWVVCLTGGKNNTEGDVLVGGRPVCDDDWNIISANIVCKELGFTGALMFTKESRFRNRQQNFIMDQVSCDGTEERLIDCNHSKRHDCSLGESAGVVCDTRTAVQLSAVENTCFQTGIGYSPGVYLDYDIVASAHDCQIHCLSSSECKYFTFYVDSHKCFRKGLNSAQPSPNAISGPRDCNSTSNITKPVVVLPLKNCNSPGVVCLKNGLTPDEGNVYIGGKPVCDDRWDSVDGRVVCQELGYQDVLMPYLESHFGRVESDFAMDDVECTGTEEALILCKHVKISDCGRNEGAGVKCDNRTLMTIPEDCKAENKICLIGGQGDHEGNVYFEGKPVCDDGWTFADAHVVCRTLGFKEADSATKESRFGIVPSKYGMSEVSCTGGEESFLKCMNTKSDITCNREEGAGVICRGGLNSSSDQTGAVSVWVPAVACSLLVAGLLFISWTFKDKISYFIRRELVVRISGSGPLMA